MININGNNYNIFKLENRNEILNSQNIFIIQSKDFNFDTYVEYKNYENSNFYIEYNNRKVEGILEHVYYEENDTTEYQLIFFIKM